MTPTLNPGWAGQLVELLDQQRCLYTQLRQLSQRQGDIIGNGRADVSGLILLLGQRQDLIHQLTRINSGLEPYRQNWPQLWDSLDAASRARIRHLLAEVQGQLEDILDQDQKDRVALRVHRADDPTGRVGPTQDRAQAEPPTRLWRIGRLTAPTGTT